MKVPRKRWRSKIQTGMIGGGAIPGMVGDMSNMSSNGSVNSEGMTASPVDDVGSSRDDDDDGDAENLVPLSYDLVEMEAIEILAEHTCFCEVCGKGFKRDANLRMHMRGHGDEYRTPAALARPDKASQQMTIVRPRRFSCPYVGCKRNKKHPKFQHLKTVLNLKNHYRRSHCPKIMTCFKCKAKNFSIVADLKTHEKHCGRDKWQCSCGTTFSRKDKFFGHLGLFPGHTLARPFNDVDGAGGLDVSDTNGGPGNPSSMSNLGNDASGFGLSGGENLDSGNASSMGLGGGSGMGLSGNGLQGLTSRCGNPGGGDVTLSKDGNAGRRTSVLINSENIGTKKEVSDFSRSSSRPGQSDVSSTLTEEGLLSLDLNSKVKAEAQLSFRPFRSVEHQLRTAPQGILDRAGGVEAQALRSTTFNASVTNLGSFRKIVDWLSSNCPNGNFSDSNPISGRAISLLRVGNPTTYDSTPPHFPRRNTRVTAATANFKQLISNIPNQLWPPVQSDSDGDAATVDGDAGRACRSAKEAATSADPEVKKRSLSVKKRCVHKFSVKQRETGTNPGNGDPPNDGYIWLKYGQKALFGYPRNFYRCIHSIELGCRATKYIQRSNEEPSTFDITYREIHTCQKIEVSDFNRSNSRTRQSDVSSTLTEEDLTSHGDLNKVKMERCPIEPARRTSDNVGQVKKTPVGKGAKCSTGSSSRPGQSNVSSTLSEEDRTFADDLKRVKVEHHLMEPAWRTFDKGRQVEVCASIPFRLANFMVDAPFSNSTFYNFSRPAPIPIPLVEESLQCHADLKEVSVVEIHHFPVEPARMTSDVVAQGKGTKCLPGTYGAEDFIREVQNRREDGYFLSSEWLLSLEHNQREDLMSILSRAGYLETYRTSMTTMFERIGTDVQNRVMRNNPSSIVTKDDICTKDAQQVTAPEGSDASLGIAEEGLNIDNEPPMATLYDSKYLQETTHEEILTNATRDISPTTLKSFVSELKSNHHLSYAVSTDWLSRLKHHEKKELETIILEAGYTKIHQGSNTTTFETIRGEVGHPAGNSCNNPSRKSDQSCVGASDTQNQGASGSGGLLRNDKLKSKVNDEGTTAEPFSLSDTVKKGRTQSEESRCRPQILKVTCSSLSDETSTMPSTSASHGPNLRHFRRRQFGDSVVTMPRKDESRTISTTIEKGFSMTQVNFSKDRSTCREVCVPLKAIATTTIACCLRIDDNPKKIRVKFSKISGEVRNEGSREQRCNALALSSLRTNVYACINNGEFEDESEEVILNLENEYEDPPQYRFIDNDLVWLKISGINPDNSEPGSITLEVQGDVRKRCKADLIGQVQRAHVLHFQELRPVVLEGHIPVALNPTLFLELNVKYQLEVSYIKPCTPIPIEAKFVAGRRTSEVIDFDCCFDFTTKNLSLD